jgi:long-chain acyl-CoA synthetase
VTEILTSADAEDRERRIAGGLRQHGLVPGDRVALVTTSGADMLCAILGALRSGIVPVLTHAALMPAERAELLDDADPALVVDDELLATLLAASPIDIAPWPLARPMHFTSGTTGRAKGVWSGLLDEHDAAALLAEELDLWQFDSRDMHLVCSPLYHSVSIRFSGATLAAGGTVILPGAFDAALVARTIADCAPNTTFMVPSHLQRLFALGDTALPPLDGFRLVAHAGAACPEALKLRAIEAFGVDRVWEFYGSTEGQFTACAATEWLERPGTVGRARRGRSLSVDDDGTIWCDVPPWARWEYWRDPARSAEAWRPASQPESWGAFTVKDLGRLDDDGYLYLDGRRDDLIITGGVNVYPAEIENVLGRAEGVRAIAVFGVDDERWGQRVCAAVVGTASASSLDAFAREHLAPHKRPKQYFGVEDLPHTATGKLRRSALASLLGAQ